MKKILDTDLLLHCELCNGMILPGQAKLIYGCRGVSKRQVLIVVHKECWGTGKEKEAMG